MQKIYANQSKIYANQSNIFGKKEKVLAYFDFSTFYSQKRLTHFSHVSHFTVCL
jgi:hypothetical protein